jgi:hypothetical protein
MIPCVPVEGPGDLIVGGIVVGFLLFILISQFPWGECRNINPPPPFGAKKPPAPPPPPDARNYFQKSEK